MPKQSQFGARKVRTELRLPMPLYDQVLELALIHDRSINATIIALLEEALTPSEQVKEALDRVHLTISKTLQGEVN